MATWYVRIGGSDTTGDGTSPATAWATLGKALGAAVGPTGGDTIWVGAGTYRQLVTCNLTSPTSELQVNGDLDGAHTGDAGAVVLSAFTGGDAAAVATASATLVLNGRDFLTFQNLWIVGADIAPNCVSATTATSTNITFRNCIFTGTANTATRDMIQANNAPDVVLHWLFDRCLWALNAGGQCCIVSCAASNGASDYDVDVVAQNCVALITGTSLLRCTSVAGGGTGAGKPAGGKVLNCTCVGLGALTTTTGSGTGWSTGIPAVAYNNLVCSLSTAPFNAAAASQIVEDRNLVTATVARVNVTAGANSKAGNANAVLLNVGQEWMFGLLPRPFAQPWSGFGSVCAALNWGSDASVSLAVDQLNRPRPAGGAGKAAGALERHDTGAQTASPTHSGGFALQLAGPADHDFALPVDATATTVSVWAQYDASYGAGANPTLAVTGGTDVGVADASTPLGAVGAGVWGQLSLSFTPTARGVVTVRLSSAAAAAGNAYFDDVAIS